MTALRELYYCEKCKNLIEIVQAGSCVPVCCEVPMAKLEAKTEDQGQEKHVPVVEQVDNGIKVKVGSVEHPMLDEHYIQFIEIHTKNKVGRAELKPGEKPEAIFPGLSTDDVVEVKEYCNVHGLWKS